MDHGSRERASPYVTTIFEQAYSPLMGGIVSPGNKNKLVQERMYPVILLPPPPLPLHGLVSKPHSQEGEKESGNLQAVSCLC